MPRQREWVPAIALTRRIGGRLLRAVTGGQITVTAHERETLVLACTRRYLSKLIRVRAGTLWRRHGPELARLGWVDTQAPRASAKTRSEMAKLDKTLDELVSQWLV